jgi:tRNA threonylcarbamoyladenosine dehydratase
LSSNPALHRLQLITGATGLELLANARVMVFGVGGVGSWCAEALVRSGIGSLTMVDSDVVCVTNINRQVQATSQSIGKPKTEELRARLLEINPSATVTAMQTVFGRSTANQFDFANCDYVIDAIDSISNKVELIIRASQGGAKVYSALGASNKLDPTRIRIASLWNSQGCPLGKYVRKLLRRRGFHAEVTCVYSEEQLPLQPADFACGSGTCVCPKAVAAGDGTTAEAHEWCSKKKQINGSAVHVTGTFGFMLAGLVVQDVYARTQSLRTNSPDTPPAS